ncbi:MAG: HEAT repeat domain-containing protein, partial [Candidatus Bilamarchaeaceae archaeon]
MDKKTLRDRLTDWNRSPVLRGIDRLRVKWYVHQLKDKEGKVRERAAKALGKIGVNEEQLKEITRMFEEGKTWEERNGAAIALGKIGDARAVPALIDALKDKNEDVRYGAAWALGEIAEKGGDCSAAVPALIDALKDEKRDVREGAAEALGKIGFDKIPIESKVLALLILKKTDEVVAVGKPGVPALIDALKDKGWNVREGAAWALGEIAEKGGDCS